MIEVNHKIAFKHKASFTKTVLRRCRPCYLSLKTKFDDSEGSLPLGKDESLRKSAELEK